MKFFISHSTVDSEIAKMFSCFLERMSLDVDVFCSSISGAINQGDDFVRTIEDELKNSDVFIPLISKNYNKSRYCLIELGYAYSKKAVRGKNYNILPFCIPPVTKSEALLGTPLSHLQTASLNDKNDIHNFLRILMKSGKIPDISITNQEIFDFVDGINNTIMNTDNILQNAIILPICSLLNNPDAIQHNEEGNRHIVNFNIFANNGGTRPDFISLVFKFPGTFNLYDYMQSNADIKFLCIINNYTASLEYIDIEFKYHEPPQMLKAHKIRLNPGINKVEISIKDMNLEGLKQISEICFVAWDRYINEPEGMFTIEDINVK